MAKRQSLYPSNLDTNLNWGSQEGLEVDRQPEDRFTSDAWDLMEDAILELERQGMGFAHSIWDTDLDTGIDTEATADDDVIRFYTDPGTERANIDGDDLNIAEYLRHLNDAATNTYIRFREDRISVEVGGIDILDITEFVAAQDTIVWNNAGANIDFRIEGAGAPNAFFVQGSDGKIGIGTAVIPHGGKGYTKVAIHGTDSSFATGPHIQITTGGDDHPLTSIYSYAHDKIGIGFDCYYFTPGPAWISSDGDSNFMIMKGAISAQGGTADMLSILYDSGNAQGAVVTWNDGIVLDTDGKVFLNDTVNTKAGAASLTINQGASFTEILALKSSGVAHGMTDLTETDTYFSITKYQDTSGGAYLKGFKDADGSEFGAILLFGYLGEDVITTKTTGGFGIIRVNTGVKNVATAGSVNANGNLLSVENLSSVKFIIDAEGDLYADAGVNSTDMVTKYDDYEDAHLVRAFDLARTRSKVRTGFDKFLKYNEDKLVELGILGDTLENGGLTNVTRLQQLHNGAIWQNYTAIKDHDKKLATYERAFEKISQVLGIPKQELLALGN